MEKCFIDTFGKVYNYRGNKDLDFILSIHCEISQDLYPDNPQPEDFLMRLGWVKVGCSIHNAPIIDKEPTQAQINRLYVMWLYDNLLIRRYNSYLNYRKLNGV